MVVDRVDALDGQLTVTSSDAGGRTVTLRLSLMSAAGTEPAGQSQLQ